MANLPRARFRGAGWGLPDPFALEDPLEVLEVRTPDRLERLLHWIDDVAESGDGDLLAAGFLGYEAGVLLEGSRDLAREAGAAPLAWFGLFRAAAGLRGEDAQGAADHLVPCAGSLEEAAWDRAISDIRAAIERGDVYQVNLTRRLSARGACSAESLARTLFGENPVPYALTVETPAFAVVSNSPELCLDVDLKKRTVRSAPIKGTVPRGGTDAADAVARARLLASEKDAAEHVMIVDLVRNDLGRVSVPGGVTVPEFRTVRTFRHLLHLESTVEGRLTTAARLSDVFRATLPAGSITGAPKRAALHLIHRLEPEARGPYTGASGFVSGAGRAVFNVSIRTAVLTPGHVAYHAGGGIVWDSDARAEWDETETKSCEFLSVLGASR